MPQFMEFGRRVADQRPKNNLPDGCLSPFQLAGPTDQAQKEPRSAGALELTGGMSGQK